MDDAHVYCRPPINPNGCHDNLGKIVQHVLPSTTVLDVGCSIGELGRYLTEQKQCIVDGIDICPESLSLARPFYRQVWEADLETVSLEYIIKETKYQIIVCADILEHLRDPGQLLRQCIPFLEKEGRILISIPNVSHMGILLELLSGDFRYRDQGLLDRTHMRFFTKRSFLRMLDGIGFSGEIVDKITVNLADSEFFESLPEDLRLFSETLHYEDSLTYQLIFEAHPL